MTVDELKSLLSRFKIRPEKKLGQNFLLSENVLDEIVAAAELHSGETVLEIGPGMGVLTRRLAEKAGSVFAVEKDRRLAFVLRKLFKRDKNVKVIEGDALFLDYSVIASVTPEESGVHSYSLDSLPDRQAGCLRGNDKRVGYKLVANIPYYITGKLLQNFLTTPVKPSLIVLLLQKEVAERIVAKAGEMSILSVSVQMYSDPEIISPVGKENFYPAPAVDSAIVRLRVLPRPRLDVDEARFFQLVKIGFSNKRKQLHNNLTAGLGLAVTPETRLPLRGASGQEAGVQDYKSLLSSLGLNPLCRAQELSFEDWGRLFDSLSKSML